MSLKEILKLRNTCPLCQKPLTMVSVDLSRVVIKYTDTTIHVWLADKPSYSITFNIDGTFEKTKQWNMNWVNPLSLSRQCLQCYPQSKLSKAAQYMNKFLDSMVFAYEQNFDLLQSNENSIYISDIKECLIFTHMQTQYIISNDFRMKNSSIKMSSTINPQNNQTIKTEIINLSNIESFNELVRKIKIYQLFS